jgi:hypothetical protein
MRTGRPTKYRKNFPERAFKLWAKGATDVEVCKDLKVSHETLDQFKKRYPEFLAAKTKAKAIADELVEQSLFKRATGFIAPDCHVSQFEGDITITNLEKHYPPDTAAIVFWLKNRKPKEWRDRSEVLLEQEVAGVDQKTVDELRKKFLATVSTQEASS